MPLSAVESVLAAGFAPMFAAETAPKTTPQAANDWAKAYTNYAFAGGIVAARTKEAVLAASLVAAFNPNAPGVGPVLLLQALSLFWIGLPVPAQTGAVSAFIPLSLIIENPQPEDVSPLDQARGLATVIAGLTLGAVKVTVPPGTIVPLL